MEKRKKRKRRRDRGEEKRKRRSERKRKGKRKAEERKERREGKAREEDKTEQQLKSERGERSRQTSQTKQSPTPTRSSHNNRGEPGELRWGRETKSVGLGKGWGSLAQGCVCGGGLREERKFKNKNQTLRRPLEEREAGNLLLLGEEGVQKNPQVKGVVLGFGSGAGEERRARRASTDKHTNTHIRKLPGTWLGRKG